MKGIILAGGLGRRLSPLTKVSNKHLLPVYDKPMIFYPIQKLVEAGIKDIMIVTGGNSAGDFLKLLGNGKEFGLDRIHYTYQEGEKGIADALFLAEDFIKKDKMIVLLGDNFFNAPLKPYINKFKKQTKGAFLLLKEVEQAERFGVAEIENKKIKRIIEKPQKGKSPYAVTGIYMYDSQVFNMIRKLKPSKRGELEITDVNNSYLRKRQIQYDFLPGDWTDAGTFDSLLKANQLAASYQNKNDR